MYNVIKHRLSPLLHKINSENLSKPNEASHSGELSLVQVQLHWITCWIYSDLYSKVLGVIRLQLTI